MLGFTNFVVSQCMGGQSLNLGNHSLEIPVGILSTCLTYENEN